MARHHDKEIIDSFESIIGRRLTDRQRQQSTLPIKHGGFGLSRTTETTSSAYLGAWANTLRNLPEREQRLN